VIAHAPVEEPGPAQRRDQRNFPGRCAAPAGTHSIEDVSVFTLFDGQLVSGGKTIAGSRSRPSSCRSIGCARRNGSRPRARGRPGAAFRPMRVAVLFAAADPAQREKFQASIEMKVAWFGSSISEIRYVADDVAAVERQSQPAYATPTCC